MAFVLTLDDRSLPFYLRRDASWEWFSKALCLSGLVSHLEQLRAHHSDSYRHSLRVGVLAIDLALELNLDDEAVLLAGRGALLHDLGKCSVIEELLGKGASLTPAERSLMQAHPRYGFERLAEPQFAEVRKIVVAHHEAQQMPYPRSGLDRREAPRDTSNERRATNAQLRQLSELVSAADVLDALASPRAYKPALAIEAVILLMRKEYRGSQDLLMRALTRLVPAPLEEGGNV